MSDEEVPNVSVHYTSENNAYGVLVSYWQEGHVYNFDIEPKKKFTYEREVTFACYYKILEMKHCKIVVLETI